MKFVCGVSFRLQSENHRVYLTYLHFNVSSLILGTINPKKLIQMTIFRKKKSICEERRNTSFVPIAISRVIKQKLCNAHIPTLFDNQKRFSECTQMLLEYQQHIKLLKSGDYFLLSTKISLLYLIHIFYQSTCFNNQFKAMYNIASAYQ